MKINEKIGLHRYIGKPRQIVRIMKITILIMTVCLLQVSALTKAQISIDAKQESLREVLKKISQQSGYDFIYSVSDFKDAKPVDLKLNNVSLDIALRAAFYSQPLIYEVSDKTVMVRKKEEKSYIQTVIDRFQAIDVRGKVVDSLGNGLPGATVSVKGGRQSAQANNNGEFILKNIEENSVLVVNYLGYLTKEQVVSKEYNFILMKESTSKLDEVQIQAYGKTSRRFATGNIATISSKEIEQQSLTNPLLALVGRIPGVTISSPSGLPGAGVNIEIRGRNSLRQSAFNNGSSPPLIVIDGLPYNNNIPGLGGPAGESEDSSFGQALNFLNPKDIESISVLKDADATAIYGSRGSNGVVLITTKKGLPGKNSIDVNLESGWQSVSQRLNMMTTPQYLEMRKEALKNDDRLPRLQNPIYNQTYSDLMLWDQNRNTDWHDNFLGGVGRWSNFQTSLAGGGPAVQYRMSGNYNQVTTMFPGENFDRKGAVHLNINGSSPSGKFRAGASLGYLMGRKLSSSTDFSGFAVSLAPNAPNIYDENGNLNWEIDPVSSNGQETWTNPYSNLSRLFKENVNNLVSSLRLSFNPFSGLELKVDLGYGKLFGTSTSTNPGSSMSPVFLAAFGDEARSATFKDASTETWSIEPQANFKIKLAKGDLDLLAGGSMQSSSTASKNVDAVGFSSDLLLTNLGAASIYRGIANSSGQYKYVAGFFRINYNWQGKYIININGRRDGSSRFGPENQFGDFGSIGAAWIFTEEPILRMFSSFLSFGKLRLTYGISGNDAIGDYKYQQFYNPGFESYRGSKPLLSSGIANPYYSWETVKKLEGSLELGFFKDRVIFTNTYFRNRSSNQLNGYEISDIAGPAFNLVANQPALIQNSGWEFSLNTVNIRNQDFLWSTSANMSMLRNKKIADFDGDRTKPGLGESFFGFADVFIYKGVDPVSGQYQFLGSDGKLTFNPDSTIKLMTSPKYFGGISNTFKYKRISLDIFLQFAKQMGKNYLFQFPANSVKENKPKELLERWQKPGDIAKYQRYTTGGINPNPESTLIQAYGFAANSDYGWVDASFIRLKNISLNYLLPDKWYRKYRINSLKVFSQAQNLFTITSYKGIDPETQNIKSLPPLRIITLGIQSSF